MVSRNHQEHPQQPPPTLSPPASGKRLICTTSALEATAGLGCLLVAPCLPLGVANILNFNVLLEQLLPTERIKKDSARKHYWHEVALKIGRQLLLL